MINVGDGAQRLCTEHKVRLKKLKRILVTNIEPETIGGMPGLLLTTSDIGLTDLHLMGPKKLSNILKATDHFMRRNTLNVHVETVNNHVHMQDMTIVPMPMRSSLVRKRSADDCDEQQAVSSGHVSYLAKSHPISGKFNVAAAVALGVPKGPLFGQLQRGQNITLPDGTVIQSEDCMGPTQPGVATVIVSCGSILEIASLITQIESALLDKTRLLIMFHLSPKAFLHTPEYTTLLTRFPEVQHVLLNAPENIPQRSGFRASSLLQAKLHALSPELFHFPPCEDSPGKSLTKEEESWTMGVR